MEESRVQTCGQTVPYFYVATFDVEKPGLESEPMSLQYDIHT